MQEGQPFGYLTQVLVIIGQPAERGVEVGYEDEVTGADDGQPQQMPEE